MIGCIRTKSDDNLGQSKKAYGTGKQTRREHQNKKELKFKTQSCEYLWQDNSIKAAAILQRLWFLCKYQSIGRASPDLHEFLTQKSFLLTDENFPFEYVQYLLPNDIPKEGTKTSSLLPISCNNQTLCSWRRSHSKAGIFLVRKTLFQSVLYSRSVFSIVEQ